MYQRYKDFLSRDHSYDAENPNVRKSNGSATSCPGDEIEAVIAQCWNTIECTRLKHLSKTKTEPDIYRSGWKTVRVFVSSTFTDFHSEREVLVKQVFPALKEWCEPQKLRIVECDLRWGVPKDSPTSTTIMTCMEELHRCNNETNGETFFINMLGERYGWIPSPDDVPEEVRQRFNWVTDASITHMELLVGAYMSKNRNAAVFLRNSSVLKDIPKEMLKRFQDQDLLSQAHLQILKEKLLQRFPDQVFHYEAEFEGIDHSTGRNLVKIGNLKNFADKVLYFFKMAISRKYPKLDEEKEPSNFLEEVMHHQVMDSKAAYVLGREKELAILHEFVTGEHDIKLSRLTHTDVQGSNKLETEDRPIVAVLGDSGIGKSALLAKLASQLMQSGESVMYHCVGITRDSFKESNICLRIVSALSPQISDEEIEKLSMKSVVEVEHKLAECVRELKTTQTRITIIVDGINEWPAEELPYIKQSEDRLLNSSPSQLSWLQSLTSGRVRCVVSCNSQDKATVLNLSEKQPYCLKLGAFDMVSRKLMVEQYLKIFNKTLDSAQLETLVCYPGASNPLWLSVACEELRVFGDFSTLTKKVQSLPPELDGLFQQVLHRLLQEDQTDNMLKVLALICCSLEGLPESHILGLLGDFQTRIEAAPIIWATLRRQMKPLLRMITVWHTGEPRIQFFHSTIQQAVRQLVLSKEEDYSRWHSFLAAYYRDVCMDRSFAAVDLPYHLEKAGDKKGLLHFLRNDFRSLGTPQMLRVKHAMIAKAPDVSTPLTNITQKQVKVWNHLFSQWSSSLRCTSMPSFRSSEYHMCAFCAQSPRFRLSPGGGKNSEKCLICGLWIPHQSNQGQVTPKLCQSHTKLAPPNVTVCNVCGAHIHGGNGPAVPGLLCLHCSLWRNSCNQCCQIVTN